MSGSVRITAVGFGHASEIPSHTCTGTFGAQGGSGPEGTRGPAAEKVALSRKELSAQMRQFLEKRLGGRSARGKR